MTQLQKAQKVVQSARAKNASTCGLPGPIRAREEAGRGQSAMQCAGKYARYPKKA